MKSLLTANDPGDWAVAGGTLHAMARDHVTCHNCGKMGHFAGDCPVWQQQQRVGFNVPSDGLNAIGQNIQHSWQEQYESEILDLRGQVAFQDMLLRDARAQEHARMETAGGGVPGGAVAQVVATGAARGPPVVRSPPLIVGGDQPTLADGTDYVRVGQTIQDAPIWGHPDIVSASIPEDFRTAIPDTADIQRGL